MRDINGSHITNMINTFSLMSSVSHYTMSVITSQNGYSPLMMAARNGETEVVSLLVKAGAALDLQNEVNI